MHNIGKSTSAVWKITKKNRFSEEEGSWSLIRVGDNDDVTLVWFLRNIMFLHAFIYMM